MKGLAYGLFDSYAFIMYLKKKINTIEIKLVFTR